jgi:SAM-dependent methyltransferase
MSVLPNDYDCDPDRFLSTEKHPHDDVHPYVAARFAAAGARTVLDVGGGNGRLARLLPALSMRCLLLDLSPAMPLPTITIGFPLVRSATQYILPLGRERHVVVVER